MENNNSVNQTSNEEVKDQNNNQNQPNSNPQNQSVKTFTQEEVNSMIQSRLATEKARWEKKTNSTKSNPTNEADKLENMIEDSNLRSIISQMQTRMNELEQKETRSNMLSIIQKALADLSPSTLEFADILIGKDAESTNANIEKFKTAWNTALNNEVEARLKGNTPKTSTKTKTNGGENLYTKEELEKMSPEALQKNWDKVNKSLKALANK